MSDSYIVSHILRISNYPIYLKQAHVWSFASLCCDHFGQNVRVSYSIVIVEYHSTASDNCTRLSANSVSSFPRLSFVFWCSAFCVCLDLNWYTCSLQACISSWHAYLDYYTYFILKNHQRTLLTWVFLRFSRSDLVGDVGLSWHDESGCQWRQCAIRRYWFPSGVVVWRGMSRVSPDIAACTEKAKE